MSVLLLPLVPFRGEIYVISIVVFGVAFVAGLWNSVYSLDKIGYFLGIAFMCIGSVSMVSPVLGIAKFIVA